MHTQDTEFPTCRRRGFVKLEARAFVEGRGHGQVGAEVAVGFSHVEHRGLRLLAAAGGADDARIHQRVYAGGAPERRRPVLAAGGKEGRRRLTQGVIRVRRPPTGAADGGQRRGVPGSKGKEGCMRELTGAITVLGGGALPGALRCGGVGHSYRW